uniref:Variant surface glycoprotein (VSG), putative n=1 Tax=Trypanosoma brucei brucei (strain 927/4 GUTat10.1) TaxID=185431 RepID=Q4FKA2_TRYB2|nr:variant surface glycoprotein (VSG), putative [Trypanosoma brucei brucei TREU927]
MELVALSTAAFVIFVAHTGAETAQDTANKIATPCHEVLFLAAAADAAENRASRAEAVLQELYRDAQRLSTRLACEPALTKQKALMLLLATTKETTARVTDELENKAKALKAAANTLRRRAQQVHTLRNNNHKATSYGAATANDAATEDQIGSGNGKTCKLVVSGDTPKDNSCTDDGVKTSDLEAAASALNELETVKLLPDKAFGFSGIEVTIAVKGNPATLANPLTDNKGCGTVGDIAKDAAAATNAIGLTKIARAATETTTTTVYIRGGNSKKDSCTPQEQAGKQMIITQAATAYALCTIKETSINLPTRPLKNKPKDFFGRADMQQLAVLLNTGNAEKFPTGAAAEAEVKQILGEEDKTFEELFFATASDAKLSFKVGTDTIEGETTKLQQEGKHGRALAYCYGRSIREVEESAKKLASSNSNKNKATDTPKSVDECKKHLTEKPCKEGGCDFDEKKPEGEKCFPKPETEKKDEKSFSGKLRVFVPQVFAAIILLEFS